MVLLLGGCAGAPSRSAPPVTLPSHFSDGGEQNQPQRWWRALGDPELDRLVEQALAGSLTLRAAWARLDQAQAAARREGAAIFPSLDARLEASRTTNGGSERRQSSLAAAYELDLWGRLRSASDAAGLEARASAADLQTAALTLSAEVADTWYQRVEQRAQVRLLEEQLETNAQLLELVQARFRIGRAAASDVHRQRQLLAQTEGERVRAETRLKILTHQLAVLIGQPPTRAPLPEAGVLPLPGPLPATGIPAELVQQRPDVQRALLRLQAADARAAAAVAERYPRVSLTAAASSSDGFFGNWLGNLVAQLAGPIVDGGRRRAEVVRTRAVVEENLNAFGQSLLVAVREVEDALTGEAGQRAFMASLAVQSREAEAVVERERLRYFQGDSDYLSVLDALRSRQQLERQQLTARRELLAQRIALARALAGGWSLDRSDAPANSEKQK